MYETQAEPSGLTNREMAAVFFNIATVLREQGNVNPFRTAAYERAGRAMMGLRREAETILGEEEKVPFRRRQHIGRKLQAKIREMVEAGELAQYGEMLSTLPPFQAGLMAVPGVGPKRARVLHEKLGVSTRDELITAARMGRLSGVPGFGSRRRAEIASLPLSSEQSASPPQQLVLFAS